MVILPDITDLYVVSCFKIERYIQQISTNGLENQIKNIIITKQKQNCYVVN